MQPDVRLFWFFGFVNECGATESFPCGAVGLKRPTAEPWDAFSRERPETVHSLTGCQCRECRNACRLRTNRYGDRKASSPRYTYGANSCIIIIISCAQKIQPRQTRCFLMSCCCCCSWCCCVRYGPPEGRFVASRHANIRRRRRLTSPVLCGAARQNLWWDLQRRTNIPRPAFERQSTLKRPPRCLLERPIQPYTHWLSMSGV